VKLGEGAHDMPGYEEAAKSGRGGAPESGHAETPESGHGGAAESGHAETPESGDAETPESRHAEAPESGQPSLGARAGRRRLEGDFLLAMRRAGSLIQLLGQVSAERIGINVTDLNCLNIIALSGSMTAGELARQTGLTTASITGVLDRLEQAGFVRRERDSHDRRRVIVDLNPGPALREIGPTFGPLVAAWRETAAAYSDSELRLLLDFQRRLQDTVRGQLARLRGEEPNLPGAGPGQA
jgi:DNA-binding HxlR family transcriptional regulator